MQEITTNGKIFYKDESDKNDGSSKFLFYGFPQKLFFQRWSISTNFEHISSITWSTAPCPLRNATFKGGIILYPKFLNVIKWHVCANKCSSVPNCKYWQHDAFTYTCILLKNFSAIGPGGNITISPDPEFGFAYHTIGSKDCPGKSEIHTNGLCPENSPSKSMWTPGSSLVPGPDEPPYFDKHLRVEDFDSKSVVIVGGLPLSGK